jgi:hypothetical protein
MDPTKSIQRKPIEPLTSADVSDDCENIKKTSTMMRKKATKNQLQHGQQQEIKQSHDFACLDNAFRHSAETNSDTDHDNLYKVSGFLKPPGECDKGACAYGVHNVPTVTFG